VHATTDVSREILYEEVDEGPGKILDIEGLLDLVRSLSDRSPITVGMVGYPNVGKSSTINRLLGYKKVPVSSTPGKTRHFQTLQLDEGLTLCDSPGLVMPSFSLSREEMQLNGILSVSQMRDYRATVELLASRVPPAVFESKYGIILPKNEHGEPYRVANVEDLLTSIAFMRGFMSPKGIPDSSRAARLIVNDVFGGKLCSAVSPPNVDQEIYDDFSNVLRSGDVKQSGETQCSILEKRHLLSSKQSSKEVDRNFFQNRNQGIHMKSARGESVGKKHFNGKRKEKLRRIYADLDV